ncbi:MAG: putative toxin-antitoxin system toxin component, PIN family [Elusimicrobia bacterium]|nr:putative toxin-antitoxin system toxin component, PIN family [Elusimicrobiota bacterium]
MIRVVLDTNVLVSAILNPQSAPARVLDMAADGTVELVLSPAIVAEYELVLSRRKFRLSPPFVGTILGSLRKVAAVIVPSEPIRACKDPSDDKFLECAVASGAAFLITGNQRHFPGHLREVRVVSPAAFLREMDAIS